MRAILPSIAVVAFVLSCSPTARNASVTLKPLAVADVVKVHDSTDKPLFGGEITNSNQVKNLVTFVNSLPQHWTTPWYGPPGGQIYFDFYKGETNVGNFYVGPNFFGRDIYYGDGDFGFYSQGASETQIRGVGQIVGFDVWKYAQVP